MKSFENLQELVDTSYLSGVLSEELQVEHGWRQEAGCRLCQTGCHCWHRQHVDIPATSAYVQHNLRTARTPMWRLLAEPSLGRSLNYALHSVRPSVRCLCCFTRHRASVPLNWRRPAAARPARRNRLLLVNVFLPAPPGRGRVRHAARHAVGSVHVSRKRYNGGVGSLSVYIALEIFMFSDFVCCLSCMSSHFCTRWHRKISQV